MSKKSSKHVPQSEDELYLVRARTALRLVEEEEEDAQDRRIETLREAAVYAKMFAEAKNAQALARINYRINEKLKNTTGTEAAEQQMSAALRNEDTASEELKRLLPLCAGNLLVTLLQQFSDWQYIIALPKNLRDLIGKGLDGQEEEEKEVG